MSVKEFGISVFVILRNRPVAVFQLFVVSLVTPSILAIYLTLIFTLPLLRSMVSIPANVLIGMYVITAIITGFLLNNLTKEGESKTIWYNYISELTSSIIVLAVTLLIILLVAGMTPLRQPNIGQVPTENADILFLVVYLSLGILLANVYTLYPSIRSLVRSLVKFCKSFLIPPYQDSNVDVQGLERPPIGDETKTRHAFSISIFSSIGVLSLSWVALWLDEFEELIEGHLNLLWYLNSLVTDSPENIFDGTLGAVEEIMGILTPSVFILYITILILSFSYATSAIFFVRTIQEKIRIRIGLSPLGMTAVTMIFCIPLLIVSILIAEYLIGMARVIATLAIHPEFS